MKIVKVIFNYNAVIHENNLFSSIIMKNVASNKGNVYVKCYRWDLKN